MKSILFCALLSLLFFQNEMPPAKVTTAKVEKRVLPAVLEVHGETVPIRVSWVSAEVQGIVQEIKIQEGQHVEQSQILAQFNTDFLEIRRKGAEAQKNIAKEQLRELMNGSRPEEINAAKAYLQEAEALLQEAELDKQRFANLRDKNFASEQEYTAAQARALSALATVQNRRAQLELLQAGTREEEIARATAALESSEAAVRELEISVQKSAVRAPFSGVIALKNAEPGQFITFGNGLFSLVQVDPIYAVVGVPETAVARVQKGKNIVLKLTAMPNQELSGIVEAVLPQADSLSRTFPVKILIQNPEHTILPGMSAKALLDLTPQTPVTAVPRDAVIHSPLGAYLYVIDQDKAKQVQVQVGHTNQGWIEVTGDIVEGQEVVVRGNERLMPGQPVQRVEE